MTITLSIDYSHHLSFEARQRKTNAMKELWRLTKRNPNIINLGTGDPHFSLYPIKSIQYEVASIAEDIEDPVAAWKQAASGSDAASQTITMAPDKASQLPLRSALAYSVGPGLPEAQQTVTDFVKYCHSPPNHMCMLSLGNVDAIAKCFRLLGNPGDHFLCDGFAYNSALNTPLSHGVSWVPIKIDGGGLIPEELERIMSNWDETVHGLRPRVLYTVPSGQNPTGCTLSLERRNQIYALCRRFDIVIIEDDPYYYLQYTESESADDPHTKFAPSFLSMDVDGRVIRLDSFSKIMMPGIRLGAITANPFFYEHLINLVDCSTQPPCALGQSLITEILGPYGWNMDGFNRWARSLRREYQRRRDLFLSYFEAEVASTSYASSESPQAGMFIWIDIHISQHPRYRWSDIPDSTNSWAQTNTSQLMEELFNRCLDAGVVVMPASIFIPPASDSTLKLAYHGDSIQDRVNFLRATFAGDEELMQPALIILGKVVKDLGE